MVQPSERFKAFVKLGTFFREFAVQLTKEADSPGTVDPWHRFFSEKARLAEEQNPWFTLENIQQAFTAWGLALEEDRMNHWLSAYSAKRLTPRRVAIIMAGNIPMVGFHDFLSVLITGNSALVKLSSNDKVLLPAITEFLRDAAPEIGEAIHFTDGMLKGFDAVIATGSDNTARYFEHYFGNKPHIIRRNRNSAAVLRGDESPAELTALGSDIFSYFGLGCRNVSKLFVPEGYDFNNFFEGISGYSELLNHRKYGNNYDYNKAVYLMSGFPIKDNGFLLLKEDRSYSSPIGSLFYEHYSDLEQLRGRLAQDQGKIQCVVSREIGGNQISFGKTQYPELWEYADGVDTVEFLLRT